MESLLLTTTTSNWLMGRISSLPSSSFSSFGSIQSSKVVEIRRRRRKIEKVTTKTLLLIVPSVSKRGASKGYSRKSNVVAENLDIPKVSWKELQYEAGSIGHRKPPPAEIDKEKQMKYITKILRSKVYDVAVETPLQLAPLLSTQLGINLWLKREDSQQVFSFKIRGAYNMIAQLSQDLLEKGIICASAGNHAQGVALSAKKLQVKAYIVMPTTTPQIKVDAARRLGGIVDLHGNTFDDAQKRAQDRSQQEGLTFIPPFDDEDVIAGQGTVGMEIGRQMKGKLHAIFVPVGGGGLVAGIASFYKLVYPHVKIFGVQSNDENSMAQALYRDEIVNVTDIGRFADGVAVRQVGFENFRICRELVDDVILVDKGLISAAIKDMFNEQRSILEPAGALSIAAAKAYCEYNNIRGVNIVAITSGANMNFDQLPEIISDLRGNIINQLPEEPDTLKLKQLTHRLGTNITEMTYI